MEQYSLDIYMVSRQVIQTRPTVHVRSGVAQPVSEAHSVDSDHAHVLYTLAEFNVWANGDSGLPLEVWLGKETS